VERLTEEQLLEALRRALVEQQEGEEPQGAMTTPDLREALGWGTDRVRRVLRQLKDEGVLEVVQVRRVDLAGRVFPRPGYRLKVKEIHEGCDGTVGDAGELECEDEGGAGADGPGGAGAAG